jgi:hypothetical protein
MSPLEADGTHKEAIAVGQLNGYGPAQRIHDEKDGIRNIVERHVADYLLDLGADLAYFGYCFSYLRSLLGDLSGQKS